MRLLAWVAIGLSLIALAILIYAIATATNDPSARHARLPRTLPEFNRRRAEQTLLTALPKDHPQTRAAQESQGTPRRTTHRPVIGHRSASPNGTPKRGA